MNTSDIKQINLRARAEELLKKTANTGEELSHIDVQALIHDLSVHQIELEMQNEELRHAEQALQRNNEEYMKLYNHAPVGYVSLDEKGIILRHNQTFSNMLGNPGIIAIGASLASFLCKEDKDIFLARFKAIFKNPTDKQFEARLKRSDENIFWVRMAANSDLITNESNENKEVLLITLSDINHEKQAEKVVKDNLQFLSTLLDTIPSPIFYKDAQGLYLGCNRAYTAITGITEEELMGKSVFDIAPQELADKYWQMDFDLFENGGIQIYESTIKTALGDTRQVLFYKSLFHNADGEKAGLVGVMLDITEQKMAEEELRQTRDAANAANIAKSQFLSNMSHEIRTPLNGIMGAAQLMKMMELTPELSEYANIITHSGENLLQLINSILDLSKIEAGRMELENVKFPLAEAFRRSISTQSPTASIKKLSLNLEITPDLPHEVLGDPLRLNQIINNLISNALKFTEQGIVTVKVYPVEILSKLCIVGIDISDTGIGIEGEAQSRIFSPFVQADMSTTRKFGGTGLGLAISRKLLSMMNGTIDIESTPGVGTTFRLQIPFYLPQEITKPQIQVETHKALTSQNSQSLRILMAEDNEINRLYLSRLLKVLGHQVIEAKDGVEAILIWKEQPVDCVLMDLQMPIMGGDEATRQIRSIEQETGQHTPILALTAFALEEDKQQFMTCGFDSYLTKPLSLDTLKEELEKVTTG